MKNRTVSVVAIVGGAVIVVIAIVVAVVVLDSAAEDDCHGRLESYVLVEAADAVIAAIDINAAGNPTEAAEADGRLGDARRCIQQHRDDLDQADIICTGIF